ncbi:hypothetical protein J2T60_001873 [Natronospira proteinivora]|uniref:Alpha-L-glutamate ligase-related protein ATP-grasp domain-containing protein n=1 Tax=Natronospira proteinivora TaxID=1807133 RepID=A0ABT1G979_9GAMM|nr:sugar-transfer associated ATP-grasp domain-containing protein [Natronospira proteinivora]MCP1727873.1 hypothetical protein [Natronospira proteinivora]
MLKLLYKWARRHKRRARVMPVLMRRLHPEQSDADYIHACYFRERERFLSPFMVDHPKDATQRQYSRYKGRRHWRAWFLEDVLAQSVNLVVENGPSIKAITGKGRWRQLLEMLWLAVRVPSMPENYYKFEWYKREARKLASEYLHRYEMKNVVYSYLNAQGGSASVSLSNKRKFFEHAHANDVAVVPIIGVVTESGIQFYEDYDDTVDFDVFVKPVSGKGGRGAERFRFQGDGKGFLSSKGKAFEDFAAIVKKYRKKAKRSGDKFLVQPRIVNHDALKPLTGEVASTCRVVTILDESGTPEPVFASFRMPGSLTGVVDNAHAGGISAAVNLQDGTLSKGAYLGLSGDMERHDKRKDNGAQIEGVQIPAWSEVLDLCRQAHEAFKPRVVVGWDVCMTDAGPLVVEGNGQPCTDVVQRRIGGPLSHDRFGKLIAFHLKERDSHRPH